MGCAAQSKLSNKKNEKCNIEESNQQIQKQSVKQFVTQVGNDRKNSGNLMISEINQFQSKILDNYQQSNQQINQELNNSPSNNIIQEYPVIQKNSLIALKNMLNSNEVNNGERKYSSDSRSFKIKQQKSKQSISPSKFDLSKSIKVQMGIDDDQQEDQYKDDSPCPPRERFIISEIKKEKKPFQFKLVPIVRVQTENQEKSINSQEKISSRQIRSQSKNDQNLNQNYIKPFQLQQISQPHLKLKLK